MTDWIPHVPASAAAFASLEREIRTLDHNCKSLMEDVKVLTNELIRVRKLAETTHQNFLNMDKGLHEKFADDKVGAGKMFNAIMVTADRVKSLIERTGILEQTLFPNAAKDEARIAQILGNQPTPALNPLDRRDDPPEENS